MITIEQLQQEMIQIGVPFSFGMCKNAEILTGNLTPREQESFKISLFIQTSVGGHQLIGRKFIILNTGAVISEDWKFSQVILNNKHFLYEQKHQ